MLRERLLVFWSSGEVRWVEAPGLSTELDKPRQVVCPCGADALLKYNRFACCYETVKCSECTRTAEVDLYSGKSSPFDADED